MNASTDVCKQFVLEKSVGPVSGCVTVAVPSITPIGMAIRVAVTTTSFILTRMEIIPEYIPDAHVNQVTRTRLNGTVQGVYYGPHNDVRNGQPGLWTFVYYVNDADGDTVFFSDEGKTEMKRTKYKKQL